MNSVVTSALFSEIKTQIHTHYFNCKLQQMSTTLSLIAQDISLYFGIPMFIFGVIGNIGALMVMLSLQTFRKNSCAFYLIIMQIYNLGELFTGLLSRIVITGFKNDATQTISFYCKFRSFIITPFTLTSVTFLCLATIDQYFATCSRPSWQRWCNLRIAHRLTIFFCIFWFLHAILYIFYTDIAIYPGTNLTYCSSPNSAFVNYHNYVTVIVLTGFLPIFVLMTFGSLAFYNVRHLNYRTVPLVRQELDKQLTTMVLLQILLNFVSFVPYTIFNTVLIIPQLANNSILKFCGTLSSLFFHLFYAGSFYIYMIASERFRRQLIYVLFNIQTNRVQ